MFGDLTAALTSFGSIVTLITLLIALALGALNVRNRYASGQDAQTIRSLKDAVDSYATEGKLNKITLVNKDKEIALLTQKADILEKHVTQAPQINDLAVQLATQHTEMMQAMANMTESNNNVAKQMTKIARAVLKNADD